MKQCHGIVCSGKSNKPRVPVHEGHFSVHRVWSVSRDLNPATPPACPVVIKACRIQQMRRQYSTGNSGIPSSCGADSPVHTRFSSLTRSYLTAPMSSCTNGFRCGSCAHPSFRVYHGILFSRLVCTGRLEILDYLGEGVDRHENCCCQGHQ